MSATVFHADLLAAGGDLQPDSILSRTLLDDEHLKVILFGFAAGQELSEHTASMPAVIHVLEGTGRLTLGEQAQAAGPGTWVYMPAWLKHSVQAETPMRMLLSLVRGGQRPGPG
jgi:quercetin dioxygenase-like cupin family protein